MNYQQPMQTQPQGMMYPQANTGWPQATAPMGRSYSTGYPQGNLGQMNGYSQANAGYPQGGYQQGYPQGSGQVEDLEFVKGIEGANQLMGTPGSRKTYYDDDNMYSYIVTFGPQGRPVDIHPYRLEECSEEMPQHLSPLMRQNMAPMGGMGQQGDMISRSELRTELEQILKEMLPNAQSSAQADPSASAHGATQSATAGRTR